MKNYVLWIVLNRKHRLTPFCDILPSWFPMYESSVTQLEIAAIWNCFKIRHGSVETTMILFSFPKQDFRLLNFCVFVHLSLIRAHQQSKRKRGKTSSISFDIKYFSFFNHTLYVRTYKRKQICLPGKFLLRFLLLLTGRELFLLFSKK